MAQPLASVDYEVFGRVQGVCFRMYTEGEAKKLGLVGWVKNTNKGTVTGQVQGPEEKVNAIALMLLLFNESRLTLSTHIFVGHLLGTLHGLFCIFFITDLIRKSWLSKVGSPSSRIDRTDFSNEKTISKLEYSNFSIRY